MWHCCLMAKQSLRGSALQLSSVAEQPEHLSATSGSALTPWEITHPIHSQRTKHGPLSGGRMCIMEEQRYCQLVVSMAPHPQTVIVG